MSGHDDRALIVVLDRIARALETLAIVDAVSTMEVAAEPRPRELHDLDSFAKRMTAFEIALQRAGLLTGES